MDKMRIVQINACFERGSTGRMTKQMHEAFSKEGHESFVFSPNVNAGNSHVINVGNSIDYRLHSFLSRVTGLQGYFSIRATLRLVRKLKQIKPDILHLHNLHNNYINLPILFRYIKKNGIATVITMHDFWFITGHCGYFTEYKCERWRDKCGNCPAIKKYNPSWFFDTSSYILKQRKKQLGAIEKLAIIGNSKWTSFQVKKSFLNSSALVYTIYNWIDTDLFYPQDKLLCRGKHRIDKDIFVVLGVAQGWNDAKGLSIFESIAKKMPHIQIVLIGEMYDDRSLPSNILCVGTIKNPRVLSEYYSLADVYCNPSIQETFGLVTAEAISCGLPVIANNETATPELVLPGCGYIIDHNNIEQYISCIKQITSDNYNRTRLHDVAVQNFSFQNISKYLDVYNKLLNENCI